MKAKTELLRFLGFNTQGDLGPWTFYTSQRKGLVWFIKAPPLEPPSNLQITMRNLFRANGYLWRSLQPKQRTAWETASKLAKLTITGFDFFTYWNLTKDNAAIETIERQTSINLIPLQVSFR